MKSATVVAWALLLGVLVVVSIVFSLPFGTVRYSLGQVWSALVGAPGIDPAVRTIVWELRLPRAFLAAIVGAGLSLAGVAMQTLVRNPLADPYLLGVSSGASVGATAVIVFGVLQGLYGLSLGALAGALGATGAVYLITLAQGGLSPLRLILTGVVMSSAFAAIASFLVFKGPDSRAAEGVMFWMLGSVAGAHWDKVALPAVVVAISFLVLFLIARQMDALAQGPDVAGSLGVRVTALRRGLFFLQALLVGAIVAVSGGIGFVGLVIPHLARMLVGSLHRRLLPVAMLTGAVFLVWVDVIARIAAPPQEIPVGVVTGVLGAPVFLLLMGRSRFLGRGQ